MEMLDHDENRGEGRLVLHENVLTAARPFSTNKQITTGTTESGNKRKRSHMVVYPRKRKNR